MLTNEEARVSLYTDSEAEAPTVANQVTNDTPVEALNLNWREKDLPQRMRTKHMHGLHPYLGKFIPHLAEIFLRKYFKPGQTILDPFVGSGTALVQANELGINAVGCDISAFNVLLCKVKTGTYDLDRVRREVQDILRKTKKISQSQVKDPSFLKEQAPAYSIPQVENEYLQDWYAPQALAELITYRDLIQLGEYHYQDVLKIILTRAARSARLTTHFDLDFPKQPQKEPYWCYKHSRTCTPTQEAFKFLKRYSKDTLRRLKAFMQVRTDATVSIYHQDSRNLNLKGIDGILTSPPYVGLIDYHEQHIYAYQLLGLEDRRREEIGAAASGSSKKARKQYQKDIAAVFRAVTQKLPSGGRVIVIAGDRHDLYDEIAQKSRLEVEDIVKRHVNRRTGRRSTEFYESIFIWRKP